MNEAIQHYLSRLLTLVSSTQIPFIGNLYGTLPTVGGIYRIFEFGADWSSSIYVGETGNLQNRVYHNLLMGNRQVHTLKSKLIATGEFQNEDVVKQYLNDRCLIQICQLADERERSLFEHFAIAILKPKYND